MILELTKQEVSHVILACETLLEQLNNGYLSGSSSLQEWENDGKVKYKKISEIIIELKNQQKIQL